MDQLYDDHKEHVLDRDKLKATLQQLVAEAQGYQGKTMSSADMRTLLEHMRGTLQQYVALLKGDEALLSRYSADRNILFQSIRNLNQLLTNEKKKIRKPAYNDQLRLDINSSLAENVRVNARQPRPSGFVNVENANGPQYGPPPRPAGFVNVDNANGPQYGPPPRPASFVNVDNANGPQYGPQPRPAGFVNVDNANGPQYGPQSRPAGFVNVDNANGPQYGPQRRPAGFVNVDNANGPQHDPEDRQPVSIAMPPVANANVSTAKTRADTLRPTFEKVFSGRQSGGDSSSLKEETLRKALKRVKAAYDALLRVPVLLRLFNLDIKNLAKLLPAVDRGNIVKVMYENASKYGFLNAVQIEGIPIDAHIQKDSIDVHLLTSDSSQQFVFRPTLHNYMMKWVSSYGFSVHNDEQGTRALLNYITHTADNYEKYATYVRNLQTRMQGKAIEQSQGVRDVLTYVRVRCDGEPNRRYDLKVNDQRDPVELLVRYAPSRFPLYQGAKETDVDEAAKTDHAAWGKYADVLSYRFGRYPMKWLFGPFTRIFGPRSTNRQVANECTELQEQLLSGKSVFVIGYGASGAGKTSTLIYFRNPVTGATENGVLIELLGSLAKSGKLTSIRLSMTEYLASPDDPAVFQSKETEPTALTFDGQQFRTPEDRTLGALVVEAVDAPGRKVRSTPNNPQSSRSHVIVEIDLVQLGSTLFIADFAGVENRFDCTSVDQLLPFSRHPVDDDTLAKDRAGMNNCDAGAVDKVYRRMMGGAPILSRELKPLGQGNKVPALFDRKYPKDLAAYLGKDPPAALARDEWQFAKFLGAVDSNDKEVIPADLGANARKARDQFIMAIVKSLHEYKDTIVTSEMTRKVKAVLGALYASSAKASKQFDLDSFLQVLIPEPFELLGIKLSKDMFKLELDEKTGKRIKVTIKTVNLTPEFCEAWYNFRRQRYVTLRALKQVCDCRSYEGAFINVSISRMRHVLVDMVRRATNGRMLPRPAFDDRCISKQCPPWGRECFESAGDYGAVPRDDAMFARVIAKKPLLAIFCVFNFSRSANNPPPTPYIDLLGLRQLGAGDDIDVTEVLSLLTAWMHFYRGQLGFVYELAMEQINTLADAAGDYTSRDKNARTAFLQKCHRLFKLLDTVNASSALGTLEFLDNMAKFGAGAAPCGFTDALLHREPSPIDGLKFTNVELI